jgi:hypothetical protein
VYRFRLISAGGDDIGPFVSSESAWEPGSRIQRDYGDVFVVQAVVPAEAGASFTAYLIVEGGRTESPSTARTSVPTR